MTNQEVEQKTTPVSEPELVATLISSSRQMFNMELTKPQVAVLIAHINLETGSSGAGWQGGGVGNTSMHNYNLGNIQWTPGSGHDYFVGGDRTKDIHGNWVGTHYKFLAFPTLEEGIKFYLRAIHSRGGGKVWNAILQGDTSAFAQELKSTRYYEEDESKYEAAMQARLKNFNKGKSYETALSGNFPAAITPAAPKQESSMMASLEEMINEGLQMFNSVFAEETSLKRLYKKALPTHNILIQIAAPNYNSAIEFSRILTSALDEDLLSTSYPYTDGGKVEVECIIQGPSKECFEAVQQMTGAIAEAFERATIKIGGLKVKTTCIMNKKSSYQPISLRTATSNYRIFLLKFI